MADYSLINSAIVNYLMQRDPETRRGFVQGTLRGLGDQLAAARLRPGYGPQLADLPPLDVPGIPPLRELPPSPYPPGDSPKEFLHPDGALLEGLQARRMAPRAPMTRTPLSQLQGDPQIQAMDTMKQLGLKEASGNTPDGMVKMLKLDDPIEERTQRKMDNLANRPEAQPFQWGRDSSGRYYKRFTDPLPTPEEAPAYTPMDPAARDKLIGEAMLASAEKRGMGTAEFMDMARQMSAHQRRAVAAKNAANREASSGGLSKAAFNRQFLANPQRVAQEEALKLQFGQNGNFQSLPNDVRTRSAMMQNNPNLFQALQQKELLAGTGQNRPGPGGGSELEQAMANAYGGNQYARQIQDALAAQTFNDPGMAERLQGQRENMLDVALRREGIAASERADMRRIYFDQLDKYQSAYANTAIENPGFTPGMINDVLRDAGITKPDPQRFGIEGGASETNSANIVNDRAQARRERALASAAAAKDVTASKFIDDHLAELAELPAETLQAIVGQFPEKDVAAALANQPWFSAEHAAGRRRLAEKLGLPLPSGKPWFDPSPQTNGEYFNQGPAARFPGDARAGSA